MAYVTVYSPKGEKFEVASRDRADKLILEDGWTQTPPVEEKAQPKKTTRRKKKEEAPVEEVEAVEKFWFNTDAVESGEDS